MAIIEQERHQSFRSFLCPYFEPDRLLNELYPATGAHSKEHAWQTAYLTWEIANEPEYRRLVTDDERVILALSGIGHDCGYAGNQFYWSGMQEEHPDESARRILEVSQNIPWFAEDWRRRYAATFIVLNHDNTNYIFPGYDMFEAQRKGRLPRAIAITSLDPGTVKTTFPNTPHHFIYEEITLERLRLLNRILQEADSRLGNAERTLAFSRSRGIPEAVDYGGEVAGIGSSMWQMSVASNILLAFNRGLLDAYTKTGQEFAWRMYSNGTDFIKQLLQGKIGSVRLRRNDVGNKEVPNNLLRRVDNIGELLRQEDLRFIWAKQEEDAQAYHFRTQTHLEFIRPFQGLGVFLNERYNRQVNWVASRLVEVKDIDLPREEVSDKVIRLVQVRDDIIGGYALDILTQNDGVMHGVFDDKYNLVQHPFTLIPPVVAIKRKVTPPYELLEGKDLVQLARFLHLPQIRISFVNFQ